MDISHRTKKRQCEAPVPGNDADRRHHQWRPFSSRARARRPEKPLAQSGSEVKQICGRRRRRRCHARDHAGGKGHGTRGANRSAQGPRADPKARALWSDITPNARRDWIHWITSAKQAETRVRRIKNACSMLAAGKRRVCCFDRSGFYSKSMSAPKAAT
jgi:hypothetical protein